MNTPRYAFSGLQEALAGQAVDALLMGPPGCGKGTQGELLEEAGVGKLVTMSAVMKTAAAAHVISAEALREAMAEGQFAPHDMVVRAIAHNFPVDHPGMLLIDGMPRTMQQVQILDEIQAARQRALVVVVFGAHSETLILRQTSRTGRPDATFHTAQRRLDDYTDETQPVVDYLLQRHGGVEVHTGPTHVDKVDVSARLETALITHFATRVRQVLR